MMGRPITSFLDDEETPTAPPPEQPEFSRLRDELLASKQADAPDALPDVEPVALPPAPAPLPGRKPMRGFGPGLGDADLQAAQAEAGDAARSGTLYDAFKGIGDSMLRHRAPRQDNVAAGIAAGGQAGVNNIVQRRAAMGQEADLQAKQATQARQASAADPASQESADARALVAAALPGLGPAVAKMSKAQIVEAFPFLEKAFMAQSKKKAEGGDQAEADNYRKLFASDERYSKLLSYPGVETAPAKTLKEYKDQIDLEAQKDLDRKNGLEMAAIAAGREQNRYTRDLTDRERIERERVTVPGAEIVPGAHPTAQDAEKVKVNLLAREKIRNYVAEMRDIHKRVGTELFGKDAERMDQLRESILVEAKNAAQLGALSGPDMGIVTRLMGTSPTSLEGKGKALVGNDNTQANLAGLDKWLDTGAGATLKVLGYRQAGGPAPAHGDDGKVTVTNGKETVRIPKARLKEAEADGFTAVK